MITSRHSIDINSDLDSLSCSHSRSHYSHRDGHQRSRRRSRLLYAEKYGLNSPLDDNDCDNYNDDSDQDEHGNNCSHLLSMKQRSYSYSAGGMSTITRSRPKSLFNILEPSKTTQRPAAFVKPTTATTTFGTPPSTVPSDMLTIQQLYEQYHKKVYVEGFVYKRNTYNTDGSLCLDDWTKLYMELCGPILFLWDGRKLNNDGDANSCTGTGAILPYYINISDATATLNNNDDNDTPILMLSTAGRNQYLIRPEPPTLSAAHWMNAIRLSCYECARLYEIYTRHLLVRPNYQPLWNSTSTTKQKRRMEGYVQARFTGDTEWKKYWAVTYDQRHEKRYFGKTKKVPCKGQFMFYESKKSKYPAVTILDIRFAYTLYPQSPQLIDHATMFKVEGTTMMTTNWKTGEQSMAHSSGGTLLMTTTTNEMMKWLVGIFDVFKLYGRPTSLLDDPMDPKALNFGEMVANDGAGLWFGSAVDNYYNNGDDDSNSSDDIDDNPQLFLEYLDVIHLPINQSETLLDTKLVFNCLLEEKLKNRSTEKASSGPSLYATKGRAHSAPLLTNISPLYDHTSDRHVQTSTFITSPSTSMASIPCQDRHHVNHASTMPPRRSRAMVYASDDSSDESDCSKSYSDQNDDESICIDNSTPRLADTIYKKEPQTPSEPSTSSLPSSLHQSTDLNESIRPYQTNNNFTINSSSSRSSNDIIGFAKSLFSKTFGMDYSMPISRTSSTSQSSLDLSSEMISPALNAMPHNVKDTSIDIAPTLTSTFCERSMSKGISVVSSASDYDDDDDNDDDNDDEDNKTDDDEPNHDQLIKSMKITTSPSFSKRPISTLLSASTTTTCTINTPTTPEINQPNAGTTNQYQCDRLDKTKRQSILVQSRLPLSQHPQQQSSIGLVHQIDSMQQQQPLWETESMMGTESIISSCQQTLQPQSQQEQQQQYHDQLLYQQQLLQQQQQMIMMMNPMMNPMMVNPMMMNTMMMMQQQQQQQQWATMNNCRQFYSHQPMMEEDDDVPLARSTIYKQAPDDVSSIGRQSVGHF